MLCPIAAAASAYGIAAGEWKANTRKKSAFQEFHYHCVELVGSLFVGQVSDSGENCDFALIELLTELFGGMGVDSDIVAAPYQKSRDVANLAKGMLEFLLICGPVASHAHAVLPTAGESENGSPVDF